MSSEFKVNQKVINLVRDLKEDEDIIKRIEVALERIFMLGYSIESADSVISSIFNDGWETIPEIKIDNDSLFTIVNAFYTEYYKNDFLGYVNQFDIECPYCDCYIPLLEYKAEFRNCPSCGKYISLEEECFDWVIWEIICAVYYDYVEKEALIIQKKIKNYKRINRVFGTSDLDLFKEISKSLFTEYGLKFRVYPHNESGCSSWLWDDPLEKIYEESKYTGTRCLKFIDIDTDNLLYEKKTMFYLFESYTDIGQATVDDYKIIKKAFAGKISLDLVDDYKIIKKAFPGKISLDLFDYPSLEGNFYILKMNWSEYSNLRSF